MKQSEKIRSALKLATALFVSAPIVGHAVEAGRRLSIKDKRAAGVRKQENPGTGVSIRATKRDGASVSIGDGGNPRSPKTKRDRPIGGVRRRDNPGGNIQKKGSGLIVK